MRLTESALRLRAGGQADWLYDPHAQRFATVEHGATMATGFAPLFLSQLFDIPVSRWKATMAETIDALRRASEESEPALVRRPTRSPRAAAEIALLAYPSAERFIRRIDSELGPFVLRDSFLYQPNVPLRAVEARSGQGWSRLNDLDLTRDADRLELRDRLLAELAEAPGAPSVSPGCYVVGHSSLLIRGSQTGVLIDPVPLSGLAPRGRSITPSTLRAASGLVALTHGHFDHYHLPSLLCFADRPICVPEVPRPSVICEDIALRLTRFGAADIRTPPWDTSFDLGDLRVHVLPFIGEQFLTSEAFRDARNWGNCYVIETDQQRVL
ncbi:MAG: MBL fold metallo-hydrolase, partial [Gemmatimonadota bacterium]|nr:MBL fold metallo-hydrolase [Gemmatimonadota bacterium]